MSPGSGKEPVLVIAPFFAPQSHAAVFRVHKLVKYLPLYGYAPIVVTTDTNYLYSEDASLLHEMPKDVRIVRTRHVEPTLRGLRMALGGRDRTFHAQRAALRTVAQTAANTVGALGVRAEGRRDWYSAFVKTFLEWPDRYWPWTFASYWECQRLVRRHRIRLLFTTACPVSPLLLGQHLQKRFHLRWVADFRDPLCYGLRYTSAGAIKASIERSIVGASLDAADMVTGLSEAYGPIFFDHFGLEESRFRFIPTGLDEAYLPDPPMAAQRQQEFLFVGEFMPDNATALLATLVAAYREEPSLMQGIRMRFIGRVDLNRPRVESALQRVGGVPWPVEFADHMPQRDVYREIGQAKACLLLPGRNRYWWTGFAKVADYIALGVPVIADVPACSEARKELERAGIGLFLEGDLVADAARIVSWLRGEYTLSPSTYCRRYTAQRQVAAFAGLFDQLLEAEHGT